MLIRREPDRWEKLDALAGMAVDDVLSTSSSRQPTTGAGPDLHRSAGPVSPVFLPSGDGDFSPVHSLSGSMSPTAKFGRQREPYSDPRKNPAPGVYRASMPDGKFINLFRVMFTDFCKMDCHYCPNSHWVPRRRFAFKVDELARTFDDLQSRHTVDGFFLSSGIFGDASKTTERMVQTAEVVRKKYGFRGYVHLKVMPGASRDIVEAAHDLGTRVSVNIESSSPAMLRAIAPMKDMQRDIYDQMSWIDRLIEDSSGGAVGQATQMVVGAAGESDRDIFHRVRQMYSDWRLKRVYYVAFRPVRFTPLEDLPPVSLVREHRLYQLDWLTRVYGFSHDEVGSAFDQRGLLSLEQDPKTVIALENIDAFPVEIATATEAQLLRVPGIGPKAAGRIVRQRRTHRFDTWRDLQSVGVVRKRAWPWIVFPGQKAQPARQLALDLYHYEGAGSLHESAATYLANSVMHERASPPAAAGQSQDQPTTLPGLPACAGSACSGCPMYGLPGHPGYSATARSSPMSQTTSR